MSYMIIFWDEQRIQVKDETAAKLQTAIQQGIISHFQLGASLYSVKGVNKIVPKYEAYDIFPEDYESLQRMVDTETSGNLLSLPVSSQIL